MKEDDPQVNKVLEVGNSHIKQYDQQVDENRRELLTKGSWEVTNSEKTAEGRQIREQYT